MKFIFVSHGDLASSMLGSAQMIVGKQEDTIALGLYPKDDIESLKNKVKTAIVDFGGEKDIICFTDLFNGSPFNSIVSIMGEYPVKHITGMNLPMVLEAFMMRLDSSKTAEDISSHLVEQAPNTFIDVNRFLEETLVD